MPKLRGFSMQKALLELKVLAAVPFHKVSGCRELNPVWFEVGSMPI